MVDGIGHQDGKKVSGLLHQLLAEADPVSILRMIIRQFRLLLLAREIMDSGGRQTDVIQKLHVQDFVAEKIMAQARHFSMEALESVYHKLLDLDSGIKTGRIDENVALETFAAGFTSSTEQLSR